MGQGTYNYLVEPLGNNNFFIQEIDRNNGEYLPEVSCFIFSPMRIKETGEIGLMSDQDVAGQCSNGAKMKIIAVPNSIPLI